MNNEKTPDMDTLLRDLQQFATALEDVLAIITGTISKTAGPVPTFLSLAEGVEAMNHHHGPNDWRDQLVRSALRLAAYQARPYAADDPALQSLISSILPSRQSSEPMN